MVCIWPLLYQQILECGKALRCKFYGFISNFGAKKRKLKYKNSSLEGEDWEGSKLEEETSLSNVLNDVGHEQFYFTMFFN